MTALPYLTVHKSGNYRLTRLDCLTRKIFTNDGAVGDIIFTLPTVDSGFSVTFRKLSPWGDIVVNTSEANTVNGIGNGVKISALNGQSTLIGDARGRNWQKDPLDDGTVEGAN